MRVSSVILTVERTLRDLVDALANRLTFRENFLARTVAIVDSGPADTDIVVAHNLDIIPSGYIANLDAAGIVYDVNRATWTREEITIRCSVSNASIVLVVF